MLTEVKDYNDRVLEVIMDQDDITWQSLIQDLIKTEKMDPWDINVSILTKRYISTVKKLKNLNFRLSGKVVLAAAVLLKMKAKRLVGEDMDKLDSLFVYSEEQDYDLDFFSDFSELIGASKPEPEKLDFRLIPRTPQPRKRTVSIYDLMGALQKALEVKNRQVTRHLPLEYIGCELPTKRVDISQIIKRVFGKINSFFLKGTKKLTFSQLLPSPRREEKIYTFMSLLHLTNQRKIDLHQKEHFGEINIKLLNTSKKFAENGN